MIKRRDGTRGGNTTFLAALFASTLLMGSSFVAGKVLLGEGFPPFLLVGCRFFCRCTGDATACPF
jgi:hypothetical protein